MGAQLLAGVNAQPSIIVHKDSGEIHLKNARDGHVM